jgi:hypothetical protein
MTEPAWEYHASGCAACTALRESVQLEPVDLVLHCTAHGPFIDRAHGAGLGCPACEWETPLGRLVRDALRDAPPG